MIITTLNIKMNGDEGSSSNNQLPINMRQKQLPDGESRFSCCGDFKTLEGAENSEYVYVEDSHSNQILEGLNDLRKTEQFCDVTLSVAGMKFPAHRNVLSSFSPYFKAMFCSRLAESKMNTIQIKEVDPVMFSLLLDFAYTSSIVITKMNVQALLSAASLLQVMPVREAACVFLEKHMDALNCLGIHCFAELHSCCELQRKAKNYVLDNFLEVSQHEEFLSLTPNKLIEFISDDNLQVDKEEAVFKAVAKWYNFKPDARMDDFCKVLEYVRLPLINPYFLHDCVESMPVVKKNSDCLKLVEEAKLFHLLPDRRDELASVRTKERATADKIEVIISVGGEDDKVVLRTNEFLNFQTETWSPLQCLPFAVSKHGLVASGRNKLYLAGGEFPDGHASKTVWRYDPVLDVWQEMASMFYPRSELGLVMCDGFIYAIGGWDGSHRLNSVEKYDPITNTWVVVQPMNVALTSPAVAAHDGIVYVAGGAILEDGDGIELAQKYDPRSNVWSKLPSMLIARSGAVACALKGNIYVVGGWHASTENTNRVECYNISTNTWSFKASMCERRYRPGISVVDGKIYVLGGEEGWDNYLSSIECYDTEIDTWSICGDLLTPRSWLSCVTLPIMKSINKDYSSADCS